MASTPSPQIHVEARDASALFDDATMPTFPHTGRMMNEDLAEYIIDGTRERRKLKAVDLSVALKTVPLTPSDEEKIRGQIHEYFRQEGVLAAQDVRVNRSEGWGSLRYAIPLVFLALAFAGVFYFLLPHLSVDQALAAFLGAFLYLVFITVVWVMLWDPIEKLLFDGYLTRMRAGALAKLATVPIRFNYPPTANPAGPA